jgi:hypothetical protein
MTTSTATAETLPLLQARRAAAAGPGWLRHVGNRDAEVTGARDSPQFMSFPAREAGWIQT